MPLQDSRIIRGAGPIETISLDTKGNNRKSGFRAREKGVLIMGGAKTGIQAAQELPRHKSLVVVSVRGLAGFKYSAKLPGFLGHTTKLSAGFTVNYGLYPMFNNEYKLDKPGLVHRYFSPE
ncbi:hypothetical protein BDZ97DRAFT_1753637 [Flammula alnicola]|nr:hypothetical protein BDZ97DRAFT_1753637 [Flammula alnicola]